MAVTKPALGLLCVIALLAGCGPAPAPAAEAPLSDAPVVDATSLVADVYASGSLHTFAAGDDHLSLGIVNRGRDIAELAIDAGPWLDEHTIAMGTSAVCDVDPPARLITCGPVPSGGHLSVQIRALPINAGHFQYRVRFFSRESGRLLPILDASGRQRVITVDEFVDAAGRQVPGYQQNAPPATIGQGF